MAYNVDKYVKQLSQRTAKPKLPPYRDNHRPVADHGTRTSNYSTPDNYSGMSDSEYTVATEINDSERKYTSWDSASGSFVDKKIDADRDIDRAPQRNRRRHQPHYENRYTIDTSSFVCITRRKNTVEINGATEQLSAEIQKNKTLLPINVTITLDEYWKLI